MLEALDYSHGRKVAHRDLKPENILVFNEHGVVKIGDFGISSVIQTSKKERLKDMVGTKYYSAPECFTKERTTEEIGPKCDIWAFGTIIVEAMIGKPMFREDDGQNNLKQVEERVKSFTFIRLPACYNRPIKFMVLQVLRQDPTQRPTAKELLQSECLEEVHQREQLSLELYNPSGLTIQAGKTCATYSEPEREKTVPKDYDISEPTE